MKTPSVEEVISHTANEIFGQPLITNVHRSLLVEAILDMALGDEWAWQGGYALFDFLHTSGVKLELKQSAAKQSWAKKTQVASKASFDIKRRTHTWDDTENRYSPTDNARNADIYIFAHHPIVDESADHRDAEQWDFYIVPERSLPHQQSIALSTLTPLSTRACFSTLTASLNPYLQEIHPK